MVIFRGLTRALCCGSAEELSRVAAGRPSEEPVTCRHQLLCLAPSRFGLPPPDGPLESKFVQTCNAGIDNGSQVVLRQCRIYADPNNKKVLKEVTPDPPAAVQQLEAETASS